MTLEERFETGFERWGITGYQLIHQFAEQFEIRTALGQGWQPSRSMQGYHEFPSPPSGLQQQMPPDRSELFGAVDEYQVLLSHRFWELGPRRAPGMSATAVESYQSRLAGKKRA